MGLYEEERPDLKISYLIRPWLTSEIKNSHTHRHYEINAEVKTVLCNEDIMLKKIFH